MTSANFNWLLHTMLFMHTQRIIQRQENKEKSRRIEEIEESDDEDIKLYSD
jgi:hypothetical protein